jgi:hypothetical protein
MVSYIVIPAHTEAETEGSQFKASLDEETLSEKKKKTKSKRAETWLKWLGDPKFNLQHHKKKKRKGI